MGPARYYDPVIGRFIQADTIVPEPGNPQALNRYAYVYNSPLKYADPSGHISNKAIMDLFEVDNWNAVLAEFRSGGRLENRWGFLTMLSKLYGSGEIITGSAHMAHLYSKAGGQPLMTVSAARQNGQWLLQKHLNDGATQNVSVFEVGAIGDTWIGVGKNGGSWCQMGGCVDYGHGNLSGKPGHYTISLAPDRFDQLGAGLDMIGLLADSFGQVYVGTVADGISTGSDLISLSRTWPETAISLVSKDEPLPDKVSTLIGLGVDLWGLRTNFYPDIVSLGMNYQRSIEIDKQ
jgi:hypothetical protein